MNADFERLLAMRSVFKAGADDRLVLLTIPGPPAPKSRPRFGRGNTYVSATDSAAERRTGLHFATAFKNDPMTGNVFVGCIFFRQNRQRIDVDNMLKHICDAANGIAFIDDSQVTGLFGVAELDKENPRTVVVVARHSSTMPRGSDDVSPCPICGSPMPYLSGRSARTCSKKCAQASRGFVGLEVPHPCRACGALFKRTTAAQTLCSLSCRADVLRNQRKNKAGPPVQCVDCGSDLTHRRGGRCRECWKLHVAKDRSIVDVPTGAEVHIDPIEVTA